MTRAIFFDLGKVIVPFDLARGFAALKPHCACPIEEIPKRLSATDLVHRFESGAVAPRQFVDELSAMLELKVGYEKFCELWSSIFLPETLIPESLLEALHRNYRLLLLSNTNAIHFEMVRERYPLLRHFDDFVLSYEVGAMKPEPRIYEEALKRARCLPEECFYTDDIPLYVEAARRFGIDAVQFFSREQIEREMRSHGIFW